jgi:hypothetical protein
MSFKKSKVVMLPTNQKATAPIYKNVGGGNLLNPQTYIIPKDDERFEGQDLYFLSDEPIKNNDWFINNNTNMIFRCEDESEWLSNFKSYFSKIIATTDDSLRTPYDGKTPVSENWNGYLLPKPSKSFIQIYIDSFNQKNQINEVNVEYNYIKLMPPYDVYFEEVATDLKVNSKNNTITIQKINKVYSQKEVDELLDRNTAQTTAQVLSKFKGFKSEEDVIELIIDAVAQSHDWSRENNDIHNISIIQKRFLNDWFKLNLKK